MSPVLLCTTLCMTLLSSTTIRNVGAFGPSAMMMMKPNVVPSIPTSGNRDYGRFDPLVLLQQQSSPDDESYYLYYEDENGEIRYVDSRSKEAVYSAANNGGSEIPQSQSQFSDAEFEQPLDPLVKALTQMDEETANAPTTKVPLIGEIPLDGSIVVLLPAAIIAVAGFIFSIVIGIQSKDIIADQVSQVTEALSTPPVKEQVVNNDSSCRGLCSDQDKQLESLKNFMQKLAKEDETVAAAVPVTKVEETSPVAVVVSESSSSTISTE